MTTSRRAILGGLVGSLLHSQFVRAAQVGEGQDAAKPYADQTSADQWMQSWMKEKVYADSPSAFKAPKGVLHVGRFADPMYYLISVIGWDPNPQQAAQYSAVRVPKGFVTDFASIPRVFWSALRPDGTYSYAAVIHDYLYWEQHMTREMSDQVLKLCMEDFRINAATVATVYNAVRIGGGTAWRNNAERKAAGERRILQLFPEDPTVRWNDWKAKPGVFR